MTNKLRLIKLDGTSKKDQMLVKIMTRRIKPMVKGKTIVCQF